MDDKKLYQPALLPHQIRALYQLKMRSGRPMTYHARRAVEAYLRRFPEIRADVLAENDRCDANT